MTGFTLNNYSDLKSAMAQYLVRTNLTSMLDIFVTLAEARIAYGSDEVPFVSDPLRIRAMETSADLALSGGAQTVALPTGFLQQRRLFLAASPNIRVDFVEPNAFWNKWLSAESGPPAEYTVEGENIVFGPIPDTSYTGKILYYQKFTPLAADGDSNWLLVNCPAAYLQGALFEAYRYVRNMDQATASLNTYTGAVNALRKADKADRYSGPWAARSDTGNP